MEYSNSLLEQGLKVSWNTKALHYKGVEQDERKGLRLEASLHFLIFIEQKRVQNKRLSL